MSEYTEQKALFQWALIAKNRYPELEYMCASLNGVKLSIGAAMKAKRGGMKKGQPDILLPTARGNFHALFIEMKFGKNKLTPEQVQWKYFLEKQGYCFGVAYTYSEAIRIITDYLDGQIEREI